MFSMTPRSPQLAFSPMTAALKLFAPTKDAQVLCFLILFAEDVDPDKVLRRYHGLDLEVRGFVKGAQGAFTCSLSLACGVFSPIFHDAIVSSAIQSEHH